MKLIHEHSSGPVLKSKKIVSEALLWHEKNDVPLSESVYRWSSIDHIHLMSEARVLWNEGFVSLHEQDAWLMENTDIGRWGVYEGSIVPLDCPMNEGLNEAEYRGKKVTLTKPFRNSGGGKKFAVYVKNDKGNVIKLGFGQSGMRIKTHSPERVRSFLARHNCDSPGPRWKARWWSCNLHRYKKQLGLNFKGRW
jgi:hypothetical protein